MFATTPFCGWRTRLVIRRTWFLVSSFHGKETFIYLFAGSCTRHRIITALEPRFTAHAQFSQVVGIFSSQKKETKNQKNPWTRNWPRTGKWNYRGTSIVPWSPIGSPRETPVICRRVCISGDCPVAFLRQYATPMIHSIRYESVVWTEFGIS